MGIRECHNIKTKKKERKIDREINTAVFMKRAFSCGLTTADLAEISIGMVEDIFVESVNDSYEYSYIATKEDMEKL